MSPPDEPPRSRRGGRLVETARKLPVPEGTYSVGAGLLVAGLTAYGFQILSFRQLTDTQYKALNGLWVIVFVVAPGFFQPLEQEVARALAYRRARGIGGAPLVKRASLLGAILAAIALAIAGAAYVPLTTELFHDETGLFAALMVAIVSYYLAFMVRGTLAGNDRFGAYGMMQGAEGTTRLLAVIALVIIGVNTPGAYGFALALPPFVAIAIALRRQRGLLQPGPEAPYSELSTALGWLLLGSLLAQVLSYAPFLGATILATDSESDAVGKFIAGLFIARIPILLFQAVQAALLPRLAALAGEGRADDFRSGMRKLLVIVVGVGVLGTIGGFTLGSWAGELLFGEKFVLTNRDLGLLAAGSGAFILALTLAQGLIALRAYPHAAIAWAVGLVAFVVSVSVFADALFLRVEIGFVLGGLVTAAIMGVLLAARIRGGIPDEAMERLVEDIPHETLEI